MAKGRKGIRDVSSIIPGILCAGKVDCQAGTAKGRKGIRHDSMIPRVCPRPVKKNPKTLEKKHVGAFSTTSGAICGKKWPRLQLERQKKPPDSPFQTISGRAQPKRYQERQTR